MQTRDGGVAKATCSRLVLGPTGIFLRGGYFYRRTNKGNDEPHDSAPTTCQPQTRPIAIHFELSARALYLKEPPAYAFHVRFLSGYCSATDIVAKGSQKNECIGRTRRVITPNVPSHRPRTYRDYRDFI